MNLKYIDGLMGFSIGDAMGIPSKNKSRDELLKNPVTKMIGFETYNLPEGTWGQATSLTIATIDSINNKNEIDLNDIALKFSAYKNHSNYTANNEVFDLKTSIKKSIDIYDEDRTNLETGTESIDNGSLMRMLPIAYYSIEKKLKDFEILDLIKKISSLTHKNEICIMGCYIYIRFVIFLLNEKDKLSAYSMTKCVDYSMFSEETQKLYNRIINEDISKLKVNEINSSENIIDTLEAAIWLILKSDNYRDAIIGAINLGEDTDTIGAITGGIAGIIYGYDYIPEEWKNNLARKEYLLDIYEEFSENKYE